MPRPKSDLKMVAFKLSAADRDILERLSRHPDTPTLSEVIRVAIRQLEVIRVAIRQSQESSRGIPKAS
jgi:hypothetical protein